MNWRGRPLTDIRTIIELIASTTTTTGLTVQAAYDPNWYEKGIKITDAELASVPLDPPPLARRMELHHRPIIPAVSPNDGWHPASSPYHPFRWSERRDDTMAIAADRGRFRSSTDRACVVCQRDASKLPRIEPDSTSRNDTTSGRKTDPDQDKSGLGRTARHWLSLSSSPPSDTELNPHGGSASAGRGAAVGVGVQIDERGGRATCAVIRFRGCWRRARDGAGRASCQGTSVDSESWLRSSVSTVRASWTRCSSVAIPQRLMTCRSRTTGGASTRPTR